MALVDEVAAWYRDHMPDDLEMSMGKAVFAQSTAVARTGAVTGQQSLISGTAMLVSPSVGEIIRLTGRGRVARDAGTPTFRFRVKFGSTTIADDGGLLAAYSSTFGVLLLNLDVAILAVGSGGSVRPNGHVDLTTGPTGGSFRYTLSTTAPVAVDLTNPVTFDFTVDIGAGDANKIIELTSLTIERFKGAS